MESLEHVAKKQEYCTYTSELEIGHLIVHEECACHWQLAYVLKYWREIQNSMHLRLEPMNGQVGCLQPLSDVLKRVGSMNISVAIRKDVETYILVA